MKNRSLAFKLVLFLSGSCLLILLAMFVANYQFSKKMIMTSINENAHNLTLRTVGQINSILMSVQKIPENMAFFLENGTMSEQQLLGILRRVTINNREIIGTAVSFEPYAFARDRQYFDPYFFESNGEFKYSDSPNYLLDDYYQIPKELNTPVWSEPYVDQDAGTVVTTYSVPFYENVSGNRKFRGVVSADISLEWLQRIVSAVRVLETGDAFLLSRNGTVITHPDRSLIMNETIFNVAEARGDIGLRELGRRMIRGESGFVPFTSLARKKKSWMCFAPVSASGWSLGVIFPEDEFMSGVTRLNHLVAALVAIGRALLVFGIILIARSITRPLHGMALAAEKIGTGKLDTELPAIESRDEVGRLTSAFAAMQTSLKRYIQDLQSTTAAKERIESELKIAHEIQASMLPRIFPAFPSRKEFDLFAIMEPAKEVGGDFYDFFLTRDDKLFFLIGDVSGKGVPAALFMMITKILMKNEALQGLPPHEVLLKVNDIVALDNDASMFATIFCGVLDIGSGRVEFANAGHNPPLLCRAGKPSEFLQLNHGFVLGPMTGVKFVSQTLQLEPGEMLFLYTDGVTEAMNPQKKLFSEKRLQQFLTDAQDLGVLSMIHSLRGEVSRFAQNEPQSDDITMLALMYLGESS